MEREGGWLDPAHHVGHQQQESPRLPHPQPLIRIRRVVLRGRTPQTITQPVEIENLIELLGLDQLPGPDL